MERQPIPMSEVQSRIDNAKSQQDFNYWEDVEQSYYDEEMNGCQVDHEGRPKIPRAGDSNHERHEDNKSIFTGFRFDADVGRVVYFRNGMRCINKRENGSNGY